ncbi:hypothetical protein LMTR13_37455 [Bradyrhizobium icense]|uniref:Transposase n=1 Tax=Bradyrhizobium icense TaxID=1274631 RepID=A0A1B1UQG7_9BRAD|nr:hypothetical protein LMTR13_37455 [Bradyrhizobium icense]
MDVLAQFFGHLSLPTSEQGWRSLLWDLCEHWNIPAFQIVSSKPRGRGAKKIWTNEKHCELFGDVQSLVASSRMTEHAACKYIAKNSSRFGERYRRSKATTESAWARTLHRQYTEAKRRAKHDFTFRMLYFGEGPGLLRPIPKWPKLVQLAIERYAVTRI